MKRPRRRVWGNGGAPRRRKPRMSTGHYTNGESRGTFLGMARTKKPRPQVETTAGVKRSRRLSSNLDALSQVYHRNAESQPAARFCSARPRPPAGTVDFGAKKTPPAGGDCGRGEKESAFFQ